jgi:lipoprotein-anchoring transpeptidase ErfK/SrfK
VVALVAGELVPGRSRPPHRPAGAAPGDVVRGALHVPRPAALRPERATARWAPVRRAAVVRAAPRPHARVVAHVGARTPEGTTNVVLARGRASRGDRLWVRVAVPGATGWVPRAVLGGYGVVRTRLVVDRLKLTATLVRDGRVVFRSRVAVGRPGAPTPAGRFYVRDRLSRYARTPAYGPIAFGTSATSPTLTDWPAGGFVGIHGTDRPDLVPGRVSHGCIRLRNRDILRLARLMPVGTPVRIR